MTCYVIDDEEKVARDICAMINATSGLELIGFETKPKIALNKIITKEIEPDITFLDVSMRGLSGLVMAKLLKDLNLTNVVLVTGYNKFAVDSYEHDVVDFLLKPVSEIRFKKCIEKIHRIMELKRLAKMQLGGLDSKQEDGSKLALRSDKKGKYNFVDPADIIYIKSLGNYVSLIMHDKTLISYHTMWKMAEKLKTRGFIRIHKSHIVSLKSITLLEGNRIKITTGELLDVGPTYKDALLEHFRR